MRLQMARPRLFSDEELLHAAARVIGRRGPVEFTLREVADEAGTTAATLVQRFGTKRALLVALVDGSARELDARFAAARAAHPAPLEALIEALCLGARPLARREELAHHLAFLQLDLTDAALRAPSARFFRAFRRHIEDALTAAAREGHLPRDADVGRLAQHVEVAYHGALITWAVHHEERAEDVLRVALRTALALPRG